MFYDSQTSPAYPLQVAIGTAPCRVINVVVEPKTVGVGSSLGTRLAHFRLLGVSCNWFEKLNIRKRPIALFEAASGRRATKKEEIEEK